MRCRQWGLFANRSSRSPGHWRVPRKGDHWCRGGTLVTLLVGLGTGLTAKTSPPTRDGLERLGGGGATAWRGAGLAPRPAHGGVPDEGLRGRR